MTPSSFKLFGAIHTGSILFSCLPQTAILPDADIHPLAVHQNQKPFINSTGLTDQVGWDKYSFFIRGKRVFIESGEFHGFRLPVVPLWKDVMQKAKAAGLNTSSVYTHWAMINPKSGVIDLEGVNVLQPLFDAAREAGLWIIARPGPYINSKTSAGGVPDHVLTLPGDTPWNLYNGMLRSNLTVYHDAWQDYINALGPIIAKNQITKGGPVTGQNQYVLELKAKFRSQGIVVPTSANDAGLFRNLINEPDIYAIDQYPLSFDCTNPSRWRDLTTQWRTYHETVMSNVPLYIPEYQGGAFSWSGTQTNEHCRQMTNINSLRVLNYQTWASGATAISFYMFYGGTNWGQLPYPDGSYFLIQDWAAPMFESRELSDKYYELKHQAMFLRSFPDLRMTDIQSEDNPTTPGLFATHLRNLQTNVEFRFCRHMNISDWDVLEFTEKIGDIELSRVFPGRDSIVTVVNTTFGSKSKLLYSTANLFSHLTINGTDVLVAYGFNDTTYKVALTFDSNPQVKVTGSGTPETSYNKNREGITAINMSSRDGSQTLVPLADYTTATRFWMPTIPNSSATIERNTLSLSGDLDNDTVLSVLMGRWPSGRLSRPHSSWSLPNLQWSVWRYADSLPEILPSFDASALTTADHTSTTSKFPPYYGSPWILYADDYGYHNYLGPSYIVNSPTNNESFPVTEDMLINGINYVTVRLLQDHMGHNLAGEICDLQEPKGIQGFFLEGRDVNDQFTGWKLAGNLGGEDFPDKTRKRAGWHLPGFDDASWEERTLWEGLTKPGVGRFQTKFNLNIPKGFDTHLAFVFASDEAQLYVNGWQMGKRIANLGPQTTFVVHEGILNYRGENQLAVSLWALGEQEQDWKIPSIQLVQSGVFKGGVGSVTVESPDWQELRGSIKVLYQ
ncbi:glycoside hydrolase family 35 protein [Mycena sp. CBHHK59/15]|nr:glycoside hydrolase family 35 protein [Mycena sp. CBHHK59/15]